MVRGHYGIDPRKCGVVQPSPGVGSSRSISSVKRYNPYVVPQVINMNQTLPPRSKSTLNASKYQRSKPLSASKAIDKIFEHARTYNVTAAIEKGLQEYLDTKTVYVWLADSEQKILFSNNLTLSTPVNKSMVGFAFSSKNVVSATKSLLNDHYDPVIDGNCDQVLIHPLFDLKDNPIGVIQYGRAPYEPSFAQEDLDKIAQFAQKFRVYARLLLPREGDSAFTINLFNTTVDSFTFSKLIQKIKRHFACRTVDVYSYCVDTEVFSKYIAETGTFETLKLTAGASTFSLKTGIPVNIEDVTKSSDYIAEIDGAAQESALMEPIVTEDMIYCFTLRGSHKGSFNAVDEALMLAVTPIIYKTIMSNGAVDAEGDALAERLKALLEVAEILSGVLDIDTLVPIVMDRACSLLHTERCSLFIVDVEKQELVTRFHGGLDRSIRIPMNRGIVGHTATTGEVINITDAYADSRFDQSVDKKTGYRTRNLMCVPIFNNRGEIAGVTEMINKINPGPFDDEDVKMLMAFNVFTGISLDNARLYQASLDLSRQLRSFVEMSSALNKTKKVEDIIEQILMNARQIIHAVRATVFLVDPSSHQMAPFVTIGEPIKHGTLFADQMHVTMAPTIFDADTVMEMVLSSENAESGFKSTSLKASLKGNSGSMSRVSAMFTNDSIASITASTQSIHTGAENICTFPLKTDNGLLGVLELSSNAKVLSEDTKLIDCFAAFAAVSVERSELREQSEFGSVEKTIKEWITKEERQSFEIPEKMKLEPEKKAILFTRDFDAPEWDGMGFTQVLFNIFNEFSILKEFNITNEKFFKFISEISSTYKKVPYHNWRHAVDVTQYVTYQLKLTGLYKKLTSFELFGLLVACICHDANHDGFTNVYNVKAETPLGILFKNQSVMETHHCAVAIQTIAKQECNIFAALSPEEDKRMWTMIISLILSTDMARHFTFLKEVGERLDKGPLNFDEAEDRFTAMDLILKCGDISNVSRPFELADKWCDVLCEEFFRQGDLEQANGMEYTSDLNDREHLNKPKSQIGFYTFVCLPLFQAAARAMPELQTNVEQIQSNLAVWKERTEQGQ